MDALQALSVKLLNARNICNREVKNIAPISKNGGEIAAFKECSALFNECYEQLETIRAALDNGWRPIESAPRDGTRILAACPNDEGGYCVNVIYFNGLKNEWRNGMWPVLFQPTHWKHLPQPPTTESGDE